MILLVVNLVHVHVNSQTATLPYVLALGQLFILFFSILIG